MLSLQRREHRQAWVLLAPMLIAMFILTAWPLARTLWLSFTDTALAGSGEATHYVWLDNYHGLPAKVISYAPDGQRLETVLLDAMVINIRFPANFFSP